MVSLAVNLVALHCTAVSCSRRSGPVLTYSNRVTNKWRQNKSSLITIQNTTTLHGPGGPSAIIVSTIPFHITWYVWPKVFSAMSDFSKKRAPFSQNTVDFCWCFGTTPTLQFVVSVTIVVLCHSSQPLHHPIWNKYMYMRITFTFVFSYKLCLFRFYTQILYFKQQQLDPWSDSAKKQAEPLPHKNLSAKMFGFAILKQTPVIEQTS